MSQYPNRSDLRVQPKPQYGQGVANAPLQKLAGPPPTAPEAPPIPDRGPIGRPSERPDEPIEAGAPFGPGPGPEALSPFPMAPPPANSSDATIEKLRALVSALGPDAPANLIAVLNEATRRATRAG